MERPVRSVVQCQIAPFFTKLKDPRRRLQRCDFPLVDLVVMAVVAVICGADDWESIGVFVEAQADWWRTMLQPKTARMPSVSTFKAVLPAIAPAAFNECFEAFAQSLRAPAASCPDGTTRKHIALDGKALAGSWRHGLGPLKLVHAWSTQQGLLLAQEPMGDGSELPALKALLGRLDLAGTVVTIDAAGTTRPVAQQIVEGHADYALAVKANQRGLYEGIAERMLEVSRGGMDPDVVMTQVTERGHGRMEERTQWVAPAEQVPAARTWPGAESVILQRRVCLEKGERREEWRYFLGSLEPSDAIGLSHVLRSHWDVENGLHWTLDVAFREDQSTLRNRKSQLNFASLRRFALTLLNKAPAPRANRKTSVRNSRRFAGWNTQYLEQVIRGEITQD